MLQVGVAGGAPSNPLGRSSARSLGVPPFGRPDIGSDEIEKLVRRSGWAPARLLEISGAKEPGTSSKGGSAASAAAGAETATTSSSPITVDQINALLFL